jgi:hypothetical protein
MLAEVREWLSQSATDAPVGTDAEAEVDSTGGTSGTVDRPDILYRALLQAWEQAKARDLGFDLLARTDRDAVFEVKQKRARGGVGPRVGVCFWVGVTADGIVRTDDFPREAVRRLREWRPALPEAVLRPGFVVPEGSAEIVRYGEAWEVFWNDGVAALCWGGFDVLVPGGAWRIDREDFDDQEEIALLDGGEIVGQVTDRVGWGRRLPVATIAAGSDRYPLWFPRARHKKWQLASGDREVAEITPGKTVTLIEVSESIALPALVLTHLVIGDWETAPRATTGFSPGGGI